MAPHDISTATTAGSHAPDPRGDAASQVERALDWLSRNFERQPSLAEAAGHAGLSEYHFQRRFRRQVGLSPKKYVQFLTLERAKEMLAHCIFGAPRSGSRSGARCWRFHRAA